MFAAIYGDSLAFTALLPFLQPKALDLKRKTLTLCTQSEKLSQILRLSAYNVSVGLRVLKRTAA